MDACCLQLAIKGRGAKDKPETYTFQTRDPMVKKEWIVGEWSQNNILISLPMKFSIRLYCKVITIGQTRPKLSGNWTKNRAPHPFDEPNLS
jgi:hypothetical protein